MILVDAGPLVALVDADDQHHETCVRVWRRLKEPVGTVWPVLAEAMYLLEDQPRGQDNVWEMLQRGAVALCPLDDADVPRMRELMAKYVNRPMDLADAALVRVAERQGWTTVFTVDRKDFEVYRLNGRKRMRLLT